MGDLLDEEAATTAHGNIGGNPIPSKRRRGWATRSDTTH
jgi:hypothetical protein